MGWGHLIIRVNVNYLSQKRIILVTIYIEEMHHRNRRLSLVGWGQGALRYTSDTSVGALGMENPTCLEFRGGVTGTRNQI